jgi:hypothetical protein
VVVKEAGQGRSKVERVSSWGMKGVGGLGSSPMADGRAHKTSSSTRCRPDGRAAEGNERGQKRTTRGKACRGPSYRRTRSRLGRRRRCEGCSGSAPGRASHGTHTQISLPQTNKSMSACFGLFRAKIEWVLTCDVLLRLHHEQQASKEGAESRSSPRRLRRPNQRPSSAGQGWSGSFGLGAVSEVRR